MHWTRCVCEWVIPKIHPIWAKCDPNKAQVILKLWQVGPLKSDIESKSFAHIGTSLESYCVFNRTWAELFAVTANTLLNKCCVFVLYFGLKEINTPLQMFRLILSHTFTFKISCRSWERTAMWCQSVEQTQTTKELKSFIHKYAWVD